MLSRRRGLYVGLRRLAAIFSAAVLILMMGLSDSALVALEAGEEERITVYSVNTCHPLMWKERPSSCNKIWIPRGLCVECTRDAIYHDGKFKDCTRTFEIQKTSCQDKLQEYVMLNPCDTPRIEALRMLQSNGTNEEEKEEGRQVLDFLAHTFCEGGCDCIPMHGADRAKPEISIERGNCQAHMVTDLCKIWPEVQVVMQKQKGRGESWPEGWESWPTVCPLLQKWVRSSAASEWRTRAVVQVHDDVRNFLDYFLEASEILEPSVYGYCYDLEVSQGNMDGIKPYSEPEPSPTTPTPPPSPFPTIHVQDRSSAVAIYHINCGGGEFTDNNGNVWQADDYFNTGRDDKETDLKIVNVAANDNQLYATNRWDPPGDKPLKYTLPVENDPNISYLVRLHFCEINFLTPDSRIFDVAINEQYVLKNYEIVKRVGAAFRAVVEEFVIPPVTDRGNIQIDFIPVFENPLISGIEVYMLKTLG